MEVERLVSVSDVIEASFDQELKDSQTTAEPAQLPTGFPLSVAGTMAWKGSDFQTESDYIFHLSGADVAELESALSGFKGTASPYSTFSPRLGTILTLSYSHRTRW